jgi:hypothetical protein
VGTEEDWRHGENLVRHCRMMEYVECGILQIRKGKSTKGYLNISYIPSNILWDKNKECGTLSYHFKAWEVYFFLALNHIPLSEYSIVFLFINLWIDIFGCSKFWQLWTSCYKYPYAGFCVKLKNLLYVWNNNALCIWMTKLYLGWYIIYYKNQDNFNSKRIC